MDAALNKHFPGQKRIPLGKLVDRLRHGETITRGTLVVMASGDRKLRARILEKDAANKGFSTPLPLNQLAEKNGITPRYVLWYFSRNFVSDYLLEHATGAVFIRVPRDTIYALPIPVPKGVGNEQSGDEIALRKSNNQFSSQLATFYDDYLHNLRSERYQTALILAGAMAEMILYQALIDEGVDRSILKDDRSLGMGKMLTYLKLLKLDSAVPFSALTELQKKRNRAIHAGLLAGTSSQVSNEDLKSFDKIIAHFGI